MTYIELSGHRFWTETCGAGETVILLHGGSGDGRDFEGNLAGLSESFRVVAADRRGHGRTPDHDGPLSQHQMADDTVALIESLEVGRVRLVGYSDGAVVALLAALRRPDLVERLVLISGVFERDGWMMSGDHDRADPVPAELAERYGQVSPDGLHHLPVLAIKLASMEDEELGVTAEQLAELDVRTLVMAADDDIVHTEHTVALFRALRAGELAIVPGTSHDLLHDKPGLTTKLVTDFLTSDGVPTAIPIRRARTE